MHTLATDLISLWAVALVFAFVAFLAWGFSLHDGGIEDNVGCAFPVIILLAAAGVTVLQVVGVIGVW